MINLNNLIRENIKKIIPYSSARNDYQGNKGIFLDANENPFGKYNRYPDPYQKKLKKKISEIKNISQNNIFLGNGSDEVIDLLFRLFCNPLQDKILVLYPTYGIYQLSANIHQIEVIQIPLNSQFQIDLNLIKPYYFDSTLKIIFICSPNNPTGNLLDFNSIQIILNNFQGIVIIDEAYIDFSGNKSFINYLDKFINLIVIQTFSKAFGLANIRLGMAFANKIIISYLNKIKFPYNISGINQKIVLNHLQHYNKIQKNIQIIINERERLIKELTKIKKIKKIYPSDANFILIKIEHAHNIYNFLMKNKIIIRNRSHIIHECLRITIGNRLENNMLIKHLNKF